MILSIEVILVVITFILLSLVLLVVVLKLVLLFWIIIEFNSRMLKELTSLVEVGVSRDKSLIQLPIVSILEETI